MPSFGDMTDFELVEWIDNFVAVAASAPTDYGTTAAEVTALSVKLACRFKFGGSTS